MSYSALQSVLREDLIERIGTFRIFRKREVIYKGSLYDTRREAPYIAIRRCGILTAEGLFIVRQAGQSVKSNEYFVEFKINVVWSRVWSFRKPPGDSRSNLLFPFLIGFTLKHFEYSFYVMTEENFEQWQQHLKPLSLQSSILERFTFNQLIGKGSSAEVYKVWGLSQQRFFACKVIKRGTVKRDLGLLKALINEITILRRLKGQPFFAALEEVHETAEGIFLVMELIEGSRLFDQPLDSTAVSVLPLGRQLLQALAVLAQFGIIHRDLKPANIMLRYADRAPTNNQVVIIDFGLAVFAQSRSYLFEQCGTRGYVAPEVMNFKPRDRLTPKVDVFSLGVILYNHFTQIKPLKEVQVQNQLVTAADQVFDFKHFKFTSLDRARELISAEHDYRHAHIRARKAPDCRRNPSQYH